MTSQLDRIEVLLLEIRKTLKENSRSVTAPKERVGGYDGCTRLRVQSSSSEPVLTREDIDQMRSLLVRCRLLAEECQNFDLVHEIQRMFQALPASASRVGPPNEEK